MALGVGPTGSRDVSVPVNVSIFITSPLPYKATNNVASWATEAMGCEPWPVSMLRRGLPWASKNTTLSSSL